MYKDEQDAGMKKIPSIVKKGKHNESSIYTGSPVRLE